MSLPSIGQAAPEENCFDASKAAVRIKVGLLLGRSVVRVIFRVRFRVRVSFTEF